MKTQKGHALSIAISGLRGSGRTSLYQQLELVLPKDESLRGCDFAFLGNPFGHLPHPLLWDGNHKKHGLSRLFECWAMLNDFTNELWIPALKVGKIPVMDSCGLDAVLYATACIGCTNDDSEVQKWHKMLVHERIVGQGVHPPLYLIMRADVKALIRFLTREIPRLSAEDARLFVEKERRIIQDYFDPGSGQRTPHYLGPSLSHDAKLKESIAIIRSKVSRSAIAA